MKKLSKITTDNESEELLEEDLSELLTPQNFTENFSPVSFEFASKDTIVSIPHTMSYNV